MARVDCEKLLIEFAEQRLNWNRADDNFFGEVPPFDFKKLNIHDSKAEFEKEKATLLALVEDVDRILSRLFESHENGSERPEGTLPDPSFARLRASIDTSARYDFKEMLHGGPLALILSNVRNTGITTSLLVLLLDFQSSCERRLKQFEEQEEKYWTVKGRPPNHYARAIALNFAKFYARQMRIKPTIGVSREGRIPSTDFGRLLEEVFVILDINANYRKAGEWAIAQLTESDWKPPPKGLLGALE